MCINILANENALFISVCNILTNENVMYISVCNILANENALYISVCNILAIKMPHHANIPIYLRHPHTPLLYGKTGVCRDIY